MEVVSHDDRYALAQSFSYSAHDLRVGVRIAFRHHRAVQTQQHSIELWRRFQTLDQFASQRVEGSGGHHTAGLRACQYRRIEFQAEAPCAFDVAAYNSAAI